MLSSSESPKFGSHVFSSSQLTSREICSHFNWSTWKNCCRIMWAHCTTWTSQSVPHEHLWQLRCAGKRSAKCLPCVRKSTSSSHGWVASHFTLQSRRTNIYTWFRHTSPTYMYMYVHGTAIVAEKPVAMVERAGVPTIPYSISMHIYQCSKLWFAEIQCIPRIL